MALRLTPRALHRRRIAALPVFALLQSLVMIALGWRYTQLLGPEPWPTTLYLHASWYVYILIMGMLAATALRAFVTAPRIGLLVAAAAAAPVTTYFLLDFPVYEAYRVHSGWLMPALAAAGVTEPAIAAFSGEALRRTFAYVLAFEFALAFTALRLAYAGLQLRFPGWPSFALAGVLFTADRVYAAHAAYTGAHFFAGQTEAFPLYLNVTADGLFKRLIDKPGHADVRRAKALPGMPLTRYDDNPGAPLESAKQPPILFILVESWRRDALNPVHMPRLWALRNDFVVAEKHQSGGNSTRPGIFALFYSIRHPVADRLLAEKRGPYFFRRLIEDGYDIHVNASQPLDFLGTRDSVFVDVDRYVADDFYYRPAVSDWMAFKRAEKELRTAPAGEATFNFVFFAATHAKYHAFPGMEPFQPVATRLSVPGYLETHHEETRNRYLNSLLLTDELIARLIERAKARPDWKDAIVVITGDHGEEFWEHGNFEHSSAFNEEQAATPLLVRFPNMATGVTWSHVTSHYDIVPTILSAMGDARPIDTYSDGTRLDDPAPRSLLQSNWNVYSLFDGEKRITYPAGALNFLRPIEVTDDHGQAFPVQPYVNARRDAIMDALRSHRRFYPD